MSPKKAKKGMHEAINNLQTVHKRFKKYFVNFASGIAIPVGF